ncbi:hypothetical protein ABPG75_008707 [Micractinium tetrahymenae]
MPSRAVLALFLACLAFNAHAAPLGSRRLLRAPAPAPSPAPGPLDRASGGGADCVAALLLLPLAGPAMTNAAAGMLEVCRSNDASCQETLTNATYLVSAAISLTLSTTVAEEAFNGYCAGETASAASSLLESYAAGVSEACLNPTAAPDAASAMSQLLSFDSQQLPSKLPAQYDLSQEANLDQAALDLGLALSSDVGTALAYTVAACTGPTGPSPTPAGLSHSPSPSPQPVPSPGWSPSPADGGDLGESGAAVLPSLEAARHDAFMQIIG